MNGIENHVDWTAPSMAGGDRVRPSLNKPANAPATQRRNVMDTLLGENDLTAMDLSGGDPYNATGRHFRR
jgi:hypothetical protein